PPNRGIRHRCVPPDGRPIFLHARHPAQGFVPRTASRNLSSASLRRGRAGETISRSDSGRRNPARSAPRRDVWVAAPRYMVTRAGVCGPFWVPVGERSGPGDGRWPSPFIVHGGSPSVRSVLPGAGTAKLGTATLGHLGSGRPPGRIHGATGRLAGVEGHSIPEH